MTATGLKMAVAGKVDFNVDGEPVRWPDRYYYKGCMFSDVPNMATVFGYLNASWTLKADIVSEYVCRVLKHMDATGSTIARPTLDRELTEQELFDFSSGYITRALDTLPRNSTTMPWQLNQDYLFEKKVLTTEPVDDGVLRFASADAAHGREPELQAAE